MSARRVSADIDGTDLPARQVRAVFDDEKITVYQAFPPEIARPAVTAGTFIEPFRTKRMTWVKPSFLWMMYRSGWATKPGQERILAIQITRAGFEEALAQSCLSHYDPTFYASHEDWHERRRVMPVRIQWDPERDINLNPQPWRSLQVGLSGPAVQRYIHDWIVTIDDITEHAQPLHHLAQTDPAMLPAERPYPIPDDIALVIGAARRCDQAPA